MWISSKSKTLLLKCFYVLQWCTALVLVEMSNFHENISSSEYTASQNSRVSSDV